MSKKQRMYFNGDDCRFCNGMCCRYVTIDIEKEPRSEERFDEIIWWLFNPNIKILKNGREWSILVMGKCENLNGSNKCDIYEARPDLCREYPPEEEGCHFDSINRLEGTIFNTAEELLTYLAVERKKEWAKKRLENMKNQLLQVKK